MEDRVEEYWLVGLVIVVFIAVTVTKLNVQDKKIRRDHTLGLGLFMRFSKSRIVAGRVGEVLFTCSP